MASFDISILLTLEEEGGFNKNLGDGAGMTYRGLTQSADPGWNGWAWLNNYIAANGYPVEETVFSALEDSVKAFYKNKYWLLVRGDEIDNQDVANFCFDFVVNSGQARKQINIAINNAVGTDVLPANNVITDDTLGYLNAYPVEVYPYIVDQRQVYLESLSSFSIFGKGWLARIASFPAEIADAIGGSDQKKK